MIKGTTCLAKIFWLSSYYPAVGCQGKASLFCLQGNLGQSTLSEKHILFICLFLDLAIANKTAFNGILAQWSNASNVFSLLNSVFQLENFRQFKKYGIKDFETMTEADPGNLKFKRMMIEASNPGKYLKQKIWIPEKEPICILLWYTR